MIVSMPCYRPNVAAILVDGAGRILIAERIGNPGAWQFPQGGVGKRETHRLALEREMKEEVGLDPDNYEVLEEKPGYRYLFPNGFRKNDRWDGQEQTYYLCRFLGTDASIVLDSDHPEFRDCRWIAPTDFRIEWVPEFKREVYRKVFREFFGVEL